MPFRCEKKPRRKRKYHRKKRTQEGNKFVLGSNSSVWRVCTMPWGTRDQPSILSVFIGIKNLEDFTHFVVKDDFIDFD